MIQDGVYGCTSGDVDIILWRDKRRVSLISTYHGDYFVRGNNQPILGLVHDYNLRMGEVKKTRCSLFYRRHAVQATFPGRARPRPEAVYGGAPARGYCGNGAGHLCRTSFSAAPLLKPLSSGNFISSPSPRLRHAL
ncbi:hypothetical protein EVAR_94770_1 [Eumeta japonica]|uniref:PiggyBac transposable element-derived protein domain-containing protein n=1 Tax=Eumeta variegata TaxID=151549 RepID=A0A4C2AD23_EUMVA|nr:hypothetical protein EVAR_94770_1 [Eumeta japonica]